MNKRIIRVTKEEYETDDGSIFSINPPLLEEMDIEEFQEHYDRACNIIKGIENTWGDNQNSEKLGCTGKDKN
jgi:hypothetical protein